MTAEAYGDEEFAQEEKEISETFFKSSPHTEL
jgi:hypothetical protein